MRGLLTGLKKPAFSLAPSAKEKLQNIVTGGLLTVLLFVLSAKYPWVLDGIDNSISDNQIGWLSKPALSPVPVIVEVDEKSLQKYGQWPWPRYQVSRLLEAIQQAGATAAGIDAVFAEPDRTSPLQIQRAIQRDLNQQLPLTSINETVRDYDVILSKTLASGPFVLSYFFNFDQSNDGSYSCAPKSASGAAIALEGMKNEPRLPSASGILCNVSLIQNAAKASGFINSMPDKDGIYRKTPLLIQFNRKLYPSLALQTYLTAKRIDNFLLTVSDNGLRLKAGNVTVPLDNTGRLLIKFPLKNQHFNKVSASDLLAGAIQPDTLKDRIVFAGFSATGLHEIRPTANSPQFLGVEFHAAIVDNLLRQDFLQRPNHSRGIQLLIAAVLTLGLFAGLAHRGPVASVAIPGLIIIALLASSQWLLAQKGMVISPALPVLMVLLSLLVLTVMKYIREYIRAKEMTLLVARTQEGIIGSFCSMSEYRDPETGAHIKRTQEYIKILARHLQNHPKFKSVLTDDVIELLFKAAPLHDIGKIGIRDHILLKKDRLNDNEFLIMQSHPQIGADIICSVAAQIGWNPFMQIAHQICLCHQEKWDGSGYPKGLSGDDIPFPARFMALADVYDALISKRCYKPAFSHNKAVGIIKEGKHKHFDPILVETFEAIHGEFREIALRFLDNDDQKNTLLANDS